MLVNDIQNPVVEIQNLSFVYPEQTTYAVENVNLCVQRGEFVVLCGPSGCGKSTLLRQLRTALAPHGMRTGGVLLDGRALNDIGTREQSQRIGFVQQNPDNQIVTDKVWHELAFGLESLGLDTPTIRRRVAEMAAFFGIENWFYKNVAELSGGQKQLLNLASIMAMQPDVLVLDEPTSQLDPIAASDFLATLGRINRELGTTIILTEHRLEKVFPLATKVAVMDRGHLICQGQPCEVGKTLKERGHGMFLAMPTAMRVWAAANSDLNCPVTVRDGREWLEAYAKTTPLQPLGTEEIPTCGTQPLIEADKLWFKYDQNTPDVVRGLSLTVKKGEFVALLGGNGTGKTTSLKLLAGLEKPYRGTVNMHGTVGVLPQNPQALFVKKSVREDLLEILHAHRLSEEEKKARVSRVVRLCRLEELLDRHPYDLSGGEQQRAALAKVLLSEPEILLMDEPTKGLDAEFQQVFALILRQLLHRGVAILMVSHDIGFCARYAHRCALFFDGSIVTQGTPRNFFSGNNFYTTDANRMARGIEPLAVTPEDLIRVCGGKVPTDPALPPVDNPLSAPAQTENRKVQALPWWRKAAAAVSGLVALSLFVYFVRITDLTKLIDAGGLTAQSRSQLWLYGLFVVALLTFSGSVACRSVQNPGVLQMPKERRTLSRRTAVSAILILLMIPVTLFAGEAYLGGRQYYAVSLAILFEMMLPFFLIFEGRKPQARELVIIAVLCALGVAGRAAFFMLPEFKPVWALTIIAGVAFGGETGFLVGAMTMLASNVMFSQGPWTPWQMFAMGLIGFLAGVLFRKGLLRRGRLSLCLYGALACVVIYGGIMNPAAALTAGAQMNIGTLLSYYITGFPVDCVHAAATWIFLWFAAEPMLEKLDRIKVKYGLVE